MTSIGRVFKDSLQPILHRLPDGAEETPCGIWDVGLNREIELNSEEFKFIGKCPLCFIPDATPMTTTEKTHVGHCCLKHGCKYGYTKEQKSMCPVVSGKLKQAHPCEVCSWEKEEMKERGEHYEYAVSDGRGTVVPCGSEKGADQQLAMLDHWTKVRRRVSEWEEFEQ